MGIGQQREVSVVFLAHNEVSARSRFFATTIDGTPFIAAKLAQAHGSSPVSTILLWRSVW
jgi:hypothetical protein